MTSTFTLPVGDGHADVGVHLVEGLTQEQLVEWKPFKNWLETFRQSMALQATDINHPFHSEAERFTLKSIEVKAVDVWPKGIGFLMMKTVVQNGKGEKIPGTVFLRGGSVAILMILIPEEDETKTERWVVMTQQPRVPAGSLTFYEIPAGMIDDQDTFSGAVLNEVFEETGVRLKPRDIVDMTALALRDSQASEGHLQKALYPSPGGCDEFIALFLWEQTWPRISINNLRDKLSGTTNEKIKVKLVKYEELWKEGARDAKTLAAWALYENLTRE